MVRPSCPNNAWAYAVVRRRAGILHNRREGGKPLDGFDFTVADNLDPLFAFRRANKLSAEVHCCFLRN